MQLRGQRQSRHFGIAAVGRPFLISFLVNLAYACEGEKAMAIIMIVTNLSLMLPLCMSPVCCGEHRVETWSCLQCVSLTRPVREMRICNTNWQPKINANLKYTHIDCRFLSKIVDNLLGLLHIHFLPNHSVSCNVIDAEDLFGSFCEGLWHC